MEAVKLASLDAKAGDRIQIEHVGHVMITKGKVYEVTANTKGDTFIADDLGNQIDLRFVNLSRGIILDVPDITSGNPKDRIGIAKPPINCVPPISIFHQGQAMKDGVEKYGLMNWRKHPVKASVYYDALMRHAMSWWDGEQVAADSQKHHLGHLLACAGIILDAEASGNLIDDRPIKGQLPAFLVDNTAA